MAKYSPKHLTYKQLDDLWDGFVDVLVKLQSRDSIKRFLKDLMNRQERIMFVRRLLIAKYLDEGYTYDEIMKNLAVGRATIARVQRWLEFGREGYKRAIKKFKLPK